MTPTRSERIAKTIEKRDFTKIRNEVIRFRREQGESLKVLAFDYFMSVGRVSQICKESNVPS